MEPDYTNIADVAKHCDKAKLQIAETQSWEYDVKEYLCDILDKQEDYESEFAKIWALFSYARYVENSIYVDTASGFVRKNHSNSFPIQHSEIQMIAKQYRNMADVEIKRLKRSICKEYTSCICDGGCGRNLEARLYNTKGKNLNRKRNGML